MRMYLDTSSSTTILELDDKHYEWESGRTLAKEIFTFIHEKLQEQGKDWQDLTEIHFFAGPGRSVMRINRTLCSFSRNVTVIQRITSENIVYLGFCSFFEVFAAGEVISHKENVSEVTDCAITSPHNKLCTIAESCRTKTRF